MADNNYKGTESKPKLPWQSRLKLFLLELSRRIYIRRDGTINRCLYSLADIKAPAPATRRITTTVSTSDVTVDASRNIWFRLFIPSTQNTNTTVSSAKSLPLIVYYHGGGFNTYSPDSKIFDSLCAQLAAKVPAVIASVNYRLAPENRYPVQYDDSFHALKFIDAQNYAILPANTDLGRCFIAGDSAGGNIAHNITLRACKNSHEFGKLRVIGLVVLQPFFGGQERTESEQRLMNAPVINVHLTDWMWWCFLPEKADRNHPAAHVFGSEESTEQMKAVAGFPRALVIMGGWDPLQDWQKMYVEWLENCGKQVEVVEYPCAFHGVYGFPEVAEYDLLIKDVTAFIQNQFVNWSPASC